MSGLNGYPAKRKKICNDYVLVYVFLDTQCFFLVIFCIILSSYRAKGHGKAQPVFGGRCLMENEQDSVHILYACSAMIPLVSVR